MPTADRARRGHPGDGRAASGQTRRHKEYHCRGEREARGPATPSTVQGEDHEPSEHACSNFGFASASFTRTARRGCFGAERQERCRLVYRRFGFRVRAQCARQDDAGRGRPLFDRHRARDAAEIRLEQPHQGNGGRIQGGRRGQYRPLRHVQRRRRGQGDHVQHRGEHLPKLRRNVAETRHEDCRRPADLYRHRAFRPRAGRRRRLEANQVIRAGQEDDDECFGTDSFARRSPGRERGRAGGRGRRPAAGRPRGGRSRGGSARARQEFRRTEQGVHRGGGRARAWRPIQGQREHRRLQRSIPGGDRQVAPRRRERGELRPRAEFENPRGDRPVRRRAGGHDRGNQDARPDHQLLRGAHVFSVGDRSVLEGRGRDLEPRHRLRIAIRPRQRDRRPARSGLRLAGERQAPSDADLHSDLAVLLVERKQARQLAVRRRLPGVHVPELRRAEVRKPVVRCRPSSAPGDTSADRASRPRANTASASNSKAPSRLNPLTQGVPLPWGARGRGSRDPIHHPREKIMDRRNTLSAIAASLLLLSLAVPAGDAAAQGARSLVGTWTMVSSDTIDASGKRTPTFGPSPRGSLIFASNGRYSINIARAGLPKFASDNRAKGTAEENQAIVAGSIGHFGKYTVDEKDKAFTFHIETSTYPNWDGTAQKRPFTVSGDELKYRVAAGSAGGRVELVWKRVK